MTDSQMWKRERFPRNLWSLRSDSASVVAHRQRLPSVPRVAPHQAKTSGTDVSRRRFSEFQMCVSQANVALYRGATCILSSDHKENIRKLLFSWNEALAYLDQAQVLAERDAQLSELVTHLRRHVRELILLVENQFASVPERVNVHSSALFIMDSIECLKILVDEVHEHG